MASFYFIFGVGYALGFSNIMTDAISGIHHEFTPDGNAVFNTALQFGGAAGTTLFSTILAIAQAGHGAEERLYTGVPLRLAAHGLSPSCWPLSQCLGLCWLGLLP